MRFTLVAFSAAAFVMHAGCSEPVPQTPRGAFYLSTVQDNPLTCGIAGHTAQVGSVNQTEKKTVIVDGTDKTRVDCSVLNEKAPFDVHAKVDDTANTGNYLEIFIPSISPTATKDAPAIGSVVMQTPKTAATYTGDKCNFYFEDGTPESVATGRVWVSFDCPGVTSAMSTCPIKTGFAIFENCLTEAITEEE